MWYFAWILGLPLAAAFAVLNAMWYELVDDAAKRKAHAQSGAEHKTDKAVEYLFDVVLKNKTPA
jgi:cyd operon protein YbgT